MAQTSQNIQAIEALQVLLQDLKRCGVSDIACDDAFNWCEDKIEARPLVVQPLVSQVSAPAPQVSHRASYGQETSKVVSRTVQALAMPKEEKAEAKPFNLDENVWFYGEKSDQLVIISTSNHKGELPLLEETKTLFDKMLQAIGLDLSSVSFIALRDADEMGKPHKVANARKLKEKVEEMVCESSAKTILLVGQQTGKIILNENLSALRKKDIEVSGVQAVALCHPQMLLKQPALKRMAWQDLLKFKNMLGVN